MRLKSLLQLLHLFIFSMIISTCASAVVDVGIQEVEVAELSPDYPTDRSPEPKELFEVRVTIKSYGDEETEGTIVIYLDDEEKEMWGTFSIKPGELYSHSFTISHDACGIYNVWAKIVMNNNAPYHDWEVNVPVKIGKNFLVTITPEKGVINKPVQVDVKSDLGLEVEYARIEIINIYGKQYKGGTVHKNEIFSFTPDITGKFLVVVTKEDEGYCNYTKPIEVRHNLTIRGPYSGRHPDDPVAGDEIVIRVLDEENEPVHGASINVRGPEERYLNTDRGGGVLFFVDEPGEHYIEITKTVPPYWGVNKTMYVLAKPVLVIFASPEKPILGDDITVKITNENISDVNITLTNPNGFSMTLTTGRGSEVTFDSKLLGKYIIRADKDDYTSSTLEIEVNNLLKILTGDEENHVMGNNLTITVLDQDDYPVPNAVVTIKDSEGKEEVGTTDHKGEVEFILNSKKYKISAEKKDFIKAEAEITPLVKKLSLSLSTKKLRIDEGSIYISVKEDDTGAPVPAKITIEGERTGVEIEETSSGLTFTPEFSDNYRIFATKENYGGAKDSFVVESVPIGIDTVLDKKELVIKITTSGKPLQAVDVSIKTPKGKIIESTDMEGIVRVNLDEEGKGRYTVFASKPPNYERSEVGVEIIRNQEYGWMWLILIIILISLIVVWRF